MNLNILKPRKALNKAFLKVKPNRNIIEVFKENLINLLDKVNEKESEEFHKNLVSDFLKNTWYSPNHFINTKGRNDLVIHNGKDAKSSVGVIIEAKKPTNKNEMLKVDNIDTKAFQELILYYLRERITAKNLELKYLVASSIYEWFIFDAHLFEKMFADNKVLVKQFTDFEEGRLAGKTTDFFYKEIAEPFIESIKTEITFTYFDFREYEKPLRNLDKRDDVSLIALFKLLSPEHLLKLPFANDSNSLDKTFYGELLHIIGLTEINEGSKKVIQRKKEGERNNASLLENAIIQLESLDKISQLNNPKTFGDTQQDRLFGVGLELVITWVNRIIFLKLMEAQLISYNKGDKSFEFLDFKKIQNFDDLNSLFFSVLARKQSERNSEVKDTFAKVPYLNSSLFEPTSVEQATIVISNLRDERMLPVYFQTVLKDKTGKKKTGELNTLEYLFDFLDAYDFSSEGSEDIQEDNKLLINASVLGLIFEKINGYKDGSFFTPGFITMYMCKEIIRRAVLQKFNEVKGYNCRNINELYNKIEDKKEANQIINSIKICDPAVGSGHFLVSALNEIIAIKSDLKVLLDRQGKILRDYEIEVVNDELIITDEDGKLFEYNPKNKESQRIQETLFHEKETIIESCLFGVDINHNSVKICRLRLWIELLKSAYYKSESNYTELETLPNIDINIKCGNSLISRFDLDVDMKQALKKSKWSIDSYKIAVQTYRDAKSKDEKRSMEKLINDIKSDFRSEISSNSKEIKDHNKWKGELITLTKQTSLFDKSSKEKKEFENQVKSLSAKIKKQEFLIDEIKSNKIYENAFEWRFEFPEALNNEGDFIGFDVVLGNPPYISLESFGKIERDFFRQKFIYFERKFETSVLFIVEGFNILKKDGLLSYIAPATWQTGGNYVKFRKHLIEERGISVIINLPFDTFEDAYVDTSIYIFSKSHSLEYKICNFDKKDKTSDLSKLHFSGIPISKISSPDYKIILDPVVANIMSKYVYPNYTTLGEITKSTQGLSGSRFPVANGVGSTENLFPFLVKGNVYNYQLIKEEIHDTDLSDKISLKQFYKNDPKLLIRRIISRQDRLTVGYCDEKLVFKKDINPFICIDKRYNTFFLLGIIASKFISYLYLRMSSIANKDDFRQTTLGELRKLPIPILALAKQEPINVLVENILHIKKQNPNSDTAALEKKIDLLVYELYDLTEDEIEIVENRKVGQSQKVLQ